MDESKSTLLAVSVSPALPKRCLFSFGTLDTKVAIVMERSWCLFYISSLRSTCCTQIKQCHSPIWGKNTLLAESARGLECVVGRLEMGEGRSGVVKKGEKRGKGRKREEEKDEARKSLGLFDRVKHSEIWPTQAVTSVVSINERRN